MADWSQNISGTINCFGEQPSTKWGSPMLWGTDKWGNGFGSSFQMPVRISSFHNDTGPTFTDTYSNRFVIAPFVNTAAFLQAAISESLRDGSGHYYYILPGGVTNDENARVPTYTAQSRPANSWANASTLTASWVTA